MFVTLIAMAIVAIIIFNGKNMKVTRQGIQKVSISLGIVIVLNLFFNYGIYTFYPSPQYDEICPKETQRYYETKEDCEAVGGEWVDTQASIYPEERPAIAPETKEPQPYCDAQATCREEYKEINSLYNRNVFVALIVLGAISMFLGFVLTASSAVSSGMLFGGLMSFFIGTVRYWSDMNDYLRLVVLGIVLATMIWFGYKKLKDKE